MFVSATMPVLDQWQGLPASRTGRSFVAADHKVECNVEVTKRRGEGGRRRGSHRHPHTVCCHAKMMTDEDKNGTT